MIEDNVVELPQAIVRRLDRAGRQITDSVIAEAVEIDNGSVTQDGVARVFARRYSDKLRFCHDTGKWYEWTGTHWQVDKIAKAFQFVRELGREYTDQSRGGELKEVRKVNFAGGVERFARSDPAFAVTADHWDSDPLLLGTPAGTIDLRTGVLREADPGDCITKITAVGPSEIADCPRWLQFLDETTGADAELIRLLQQWCGYALTGLTREHALVFVYGPGGNGKSVFLNIVTSILKQYAATSSMDAFTASKSDRHLTEIAKLCGARLVTASETEQGKAWAESRIKQLTGGDRISARFMRQDEFEFVPQLKLMIVGNHKPVLRNVDDAARRRFLIVPFERKPQAPDRELEQKLINEAPGVLKWMIDGCLDWLANGLIRPPSVIAATDSYFDDQDLLGQWIEEKCETAVKNPPIWDRSADLFESWCKFAAKAGEDPGKQKTFSPMLQKRGFDAYRATGGIRAFRHIRVKAESVFQNSDAS
jgi:putative DNA primase/helicase